MKPVYLLCLLLTPFFYAPAQTKSEVSYWVRKHAFSSAMVKMRATVTVWNGSLPAETMEYNGDKLDQHTLYRADGLPAETRIYLYNPDTVLTRIVYTYNEQKQKIAETSYSSMGEIKLSGKKYRYNTQGLPEELTYSYINKADRKVDVTERFIYDAQGNLLRKTHSHNRSKYPEIWQYEYSVGENNHRKVKEYYKARRKFRLKKTSTYDSANRLIRELEKINSEKVVRTFVYSLDEQGDWTSQKIYEQSFIYDPKFIGEYRKTRLQ